MRVWCVYFTMALHNLKNFKWKAEVKYIYWHWPKYIHMLPEEQTENISWFIFSHKDSYYPMKARCANVPLWKSTFRQQVPPRGQLLSLNHCRPERSFRWVVVLGASGASGNRARWQKQGHYKSLTSIIKFCYWSFTSKLTCWGSASGLCWKRGWRTVTWKTTNIRT